MRITVTIEDRVGKALKVLAHRSGKSFKQVVNETLRRGLAESGFRAKSPYRERPSRLGGARSVCDLTKALSLAAALEDEVRNPLDILKGSVTEYIQPTEPGADGDWEALA